MRDKRFIAEHRGGPLGREKHRKLMRWACACARHVLSLASKPLAEELNKTLETGLRWERGQDSMGECIKASRRAHRAARMAGTAVSTALWHAAGHVAATAHMADHSLGAAYYSLKAVERAGRPVDSERKRQDRILTPGIRELVRSARKRRKI